MNEEFADELRALFQSIADNEGDMELVDKDMEEFNNKKIKANDNK